MPHRCLGIILIAMTLGCQRSEDKSSAVPTRPRDESPDLWQAAERGQLSRIEQLLAGAAGVNDKNAEGETALMKAAANNHVAVIRALEARGADFDERDRNGEDALMKAAANGHLAAVQVLLSKGSDLMLKAQDRNGMTALMKAAANGHLLVVQEMVNFVSFPFERRINVGAKDLQERTALDHAREKGHKEIAAFLISKMKPKSCRTTPQRGPMIGA